MTTPATGAGTVRKARLADGPAIQSLVDTFASRDEMLRRTLAEIYEHIREFLVVEDQGKIVACGALHVLWSHLGEVRSLAVAEGSQGRGYGREIVLECVREGEELGLRQVFALTYKPGFFERLGFRVVEKAYLPHKVWNDCIRCPKFVGCSEIAVVRDLGPEPEPEIEPRFKAVELPVLFG